MTEEKQADFPSVDAAFAFVVPSYQIMASRYEAADTRLAALMTWAISMTVAIPVFSRAVNPNVRFGSVWFLGGMACFALCLAAGMVGRLCGRLTVADPSVHFNKGLRWPEWEFKKTAIYWAGEHMARNAWSIDTKSRAEYWTIAFLALEAVCLVCWTMEVPNPFSR